VAAIVKYLPTEANYRAIIGLVGVAIIVISLSILQIVLGSFQQEKAIAYENPNGQVTVSLSAIEDLITRMAKDFDEVRDLKPYAKISKEGVQITCKAVLFEQKSVPKIAEKIQDAIRNEIQSMLAMEEELSVKIHVVKFASKEKKKKKKQQEEKPEAPYQYRSKA
jgi:uncharacterized alkaline shock family protein YloU